MWRAVVEAAGPFLIPFALYALWLAAMKRAAPGGEASGAAAGRTHPWILLSILGLALAFAVLVFTSTRERMPVGTDYEPARIDESGRILPGGPPPR